MEIPNWLPLDIWQEWIEYRKEDLKKPATDRSLKMTIKKLSRLRGEGYCPIKLIEKAIESEWRGIYAHDDCKANQESGRKLSAAEEYRNANTPAYFRIVGGNG